MKKLLLSIVAFLAGVSFTPAAVTIVTIGDGAAFDDAIAGAISGPFLDADTSFSATVTTHVVSPSGALNSNASGFGVNADGGDDANNAFDTGESWTFSFSRDIQFEGINFSLFTGSETATLQSSAFVGLLISPDNSSVAFDSVTGTFTFSDNGSSDVFQKADIAGDATLTVPAGVHMTFAAGPDSSISIEDITVTIVPEPGTLIMLLGGAGMLGLLRRRW